MLSIVISTLCTKTTTTTTTTTITTVLRTLYRSTCVPAPPVKNWRISLVQSITDPHVLADGTQRIRIRQKTLELSPHCFCAFCTRDNRRTLREKVLPQTGQAYGRWPVCRRECRSRFDRDVNVFNQQSINRLSYITLPLLATTCPTLSVPSQPSSNVLRKLTFIPTYPTY